MKLIYNNFDGLDLSFQGALSHETLDQLAEARSLAQNEKREVLAYIGKEKLPVMVAETGAKGGYKYRFDTGIDGEIWFIAHSINSKLWNIRVSVKSPALALSGYETVKKRLLKRLISFEARGISAYDFEISANNKRLYLPLERISRFDYCFDFIMDSSFQPLSERFVAHQRTKKHSYGERIISDYSASNGDKTNTIRIGETTNKQIAIYNKTKEISASSKHYWWNIWGIDPAPFKEGKQQIWRIEARAGRDELDKWPLKRFHEFEQKAGDVISNILETIRYTTPTSDNNRSRWPIAPLWQETINTAHTALSQYSTSAIRENIIEDYRENIINAYSERVLGNLIGMTAAMDRDISELPSIAAELEHLVAFKIQQDKQNILKKYNRATERFALLK